MAKFLRAGCILNKPEQDRADEEEEAQDDDAQIGELGESGEECGGLELDEDDDYGEAVLESEDDDSNPNSPVHINKGHASCKRDCRQGGPHEDESARDECRSRCTSGASLADTHAENQRELREVENDAAKQTLVDRTLGLPRRNILENPFFKSRARRLAVQGAWADAQLVPFTNAATGHRENVAAMKGQGAGEDDSACKFFFKIDGASSRCTRDVWRRAGGVRTKKGGWNVLWGRPLKYAEHKKLNCFQRVCHFPGTWYLGRKDSLAKCVAKFKRANGHHRFI